VTDINRSSYEDILDEQHEAYSKPRRSDRGVALIAVLLLLALMSALAVALVYKVTTSNTCSARIWPTRWRSMVPKPMEKMMADLSNLYAQSRPHELRHHQSAGFGSQPNRGWRHLSQYVYNVPAPNGGDARLPYYCPDY